MVPSLIKKARFTPSSVVTDTDTTEIGGGLIDVSLCDGFLYCASVFSKSIAEAMLSFCLIVDLVDLMLRSNENLDKFLANAYNRNLRWY